MKKLFLFLWMLFASLYLPAQQVAVADSLKREYAKAANHESLVYLSGLLSKIYMSIDPRQSDVYGNKAIEHAEVSRNRKLITEAFLYNGERYSYLGGKKENIEKAVGYYQKAYETSRQSKLEKEMSVALLGLADVHRMIPDADKSLGFVTQAFSVISGLKNKDSLLAECYLDFGNAYLIKKEKLLALRNYFSAMRIAEDIKPSLPFLLHSCYYSLSEFYLNVNDYDKALDFAFKAKDVIHQTNEANAKYVRVNDVRYIGQLFVLKKNYKLAQEQYELAIRMADSIKYEPLKFSPYISILNLFLESDEPQKALEYFNTNQPLKEYITRFGFSKVIDQAYGFIYTELKQFDSAKYYFEKALPFFENEANNYSKISFLHQLSMFYYKSGDYGNAVKWLSKAMSKAEEIKNMDWQRRISISLDSAYQKLGDYRQALLYAGKSMALKDSMDKLGKEEDILQLQIADEQERQARLDAEAEEKKKQRHRFQFLAITIGIAVLFVALVMMGMFKVSASTIRILGFFAFLMLFEFLFLVFKKQFYAFTQGEPWKDLVFMIGLAAILLPLHHWLEHKVISYLTSHNRLKLPAGKKILKNIFGKNEDET